MIRQTLLGCLLFATVQLGIAQSNSNFQFGILLALDYNYLKAEQTAWVNSSDANTIDIQHEAGFQLGILCRFKLNDYLAIVPQPTLAFRGNSVAFDLENEVPHQENIEPINVELPLHFVFTNDKGKKLSPSVFAGGRYLYNIANPSEEDYRLDLKRHNFAIDLGTGVEIKLDKFTFKPELSYSLGLLNLKNSDTDIYNAALRSIHQDRIALRLKFYH